MTTGIFKPNSTLDTSELGPDLGVLLFDGYTGQSRLLGDTSVILVGGRSLPYQKVPESTYLFYAVRRGNYTVQVRSAEESPYYLGVDIPITLPMPNSLWPAFPDVTLADLSKPLDDPAQPAAYRAQRDLAGLRPSTAYPFPADATLVRGTVSSRTVPVAGAMVQNLGGNERYLTGGDGGFVLPLSRPVGMIGKITVRASHPIYPTFQQDVTVRRGATTGLNIDMGP